MIFSEIKLSELREKLKLLLSAKRFSHTIGVEKCAAAIGAVLMPDSIEELRAAALLHDVAKEICIDEQLELLRESKFPLTDEDAATAGVIHSFTAPLIIKRDFPDFANDNILSSVEKHTVGAESMSVFDKIIFISDYIEDNRTFESCVNVRNFLFENFDNLTKNDALARLNKACIAAIDGSVSALEKQGRVVNSRMLDTRNSLMKQIMQS